MAYDNVLYSKANRIARITLNNPEKLNPLSNLLRDDPFQDEFRKRTGGS